VGITYGGFLLSGPENIIEGMREFERDLRDIFAERHADLQPKLKELLLELWLRGTKLGERFATPTDNPNNGMHPTEDFGPEMRLDDATGRMRTLSEQESLSDLERRINLLAPQLLNPVNTTGLEQQLDVIIQRDGGLVTNAMANIGIQNAWNYVPVVMNKETGEVFGVDIPTRQKIKIAPVTLQLVCNDGGGHKWDCPYGAGPPIQRDPYASHVICRVNGEIKSAPTDYTIITTYNNEDCIESIFFGVLLDSSTETVELTYNSRTTEYF
jgi:hypothetical protein